MSKYEVVIGLEVHAELATQSKVFCGCSTLFGQPSNTQTCPVCLGLPGALPVLNRTALEYALKAAVAFHSTINQHTIFERKNYYYPDLPKAYQISQKALPLGVGGYLEIELDGGVRRVGIEDVHLEEDTGKSLHGADAGFDTASLIDYNRSGRPLLEMVSKPDMRSIEEAEAYMNAIRNLLLYLDISDCKMEHGSLRFEASISLRPHGETQLGKRVEIKNLNSFRAVVNSLHAEQARQEAILSSGGVVEQQTMLWDEVRGVTEPMRSKEEAQDYRYFAEPDLAPVIIDDAWLAQVRVGLPELPLARRQRFIAEYGLPEYDAAVLTATRTSAEFFETATQHTKAYKAVSNWMMGDFTALLNDDGIDIAESKVTPEALAALVNLVEDGSISGKIAKDVFAEMYATGRAPAEIVAAKGLTQISDASALEEVIRQIIADNSKAADDFRSGNTKTMGFFVGQVMKATKGQANPQMVNDLLRRILAE